MDKTPSEPPTKVPVKDNSLVSIRIRLRYPDEETFIEKYSANISRGGMFIQSRSPQPVGQNLRFEMLLNDNSLLIKGEGQVIWVREYDDKAPQQVHGMGIKFIKIDAPSRELIDRVLAFKKAKEDSQALSLLQRPSQTQEIRNLAHTVQPLEEDLEAEESDISAEIEMQDSQSAHFSPQRHHDSQTLTGHQAPAVNEGRQPPGGAQTTNGRKENHSKESRTSPPPIPLQPSPSPQNLELSPEGRFESQNLPSVPSSAALTLNHVAARDEMEKNDEELAQAALDSGGDGVKVVLATAENILSQIIAESHLAEEQIAATIQEILARSVAYEELAEIEAFLESQELSPASPGNIPRVYHAPITTPPADNVGSFSSFSNANLEDEGDKAAPSSDDQPPSEELFSSSIMTAAVHQAQIQQHDLQHKDFDFSEDTAVQGGENGFKDIQPDKTDVDSEEETSEAPDEGWAALETATEWLGHESSHILQDMAAHTTRSSVEAAQDAAPINDEQVPHGAESSDDTESAHDEQAVDALAEPVSAENDFKYQRLDDLEATDENLLFDGSSMEPPGDPAEQKSKEPLFDKDVDEDVDRLLENLESEPEIFTDSHYAPAPDEKEDNAVHEMERQEDTERYSSSELPAVLQETEPKDALGNGASNPHDPFEDDSVDGLSLDDLHNLISEDAEEAGHQPFDPSTKGIASLDSRGEDRNSKDQLNYRELEEEDTETQLEHYDEDTPLVGAAEFQSDSATAVDGNLDFTEEMKALQTEDEDHSYSDAHFKSGAINEATQPYADGSQDPIPSLDELAKQVMPSQTTEPLPEDHLDYPQDGPHAAQPPQDTPIKARKSSLFKRLFGKKVDK